MTIEQRKLLISMKQELENGSNLDSVKEICLHKLNKIAKLEFETINGSDRDVLQFAYNLSDGGVMQ